MNKFDAVHTAIGRIQDYINGAMKWSKEWEDDTWRNGYQNALLDVLDFIDSPNGLDISDLIKED